MSFSIVFEGKEDWFELYTRFTLNKHKLYSFIWFIFHIFKKVQFVTCYPEFIIFY